MAASLFSNLMATKEKGAGKSNQDTYPKRVTRWI
jgi:hypothetical protein